MRRTERGGVFFRLMFLIVLIGLLGLVYLVRNPLLRLIGSFWIVDEPAAHADAMIVLSDDNFGGDRAAHAAELYRQGVAPVIVPSDRLLRPNAEVGDMIARDLQARGVPASAIVKSTPYRAADTREEAVALRDFVASHGWKRIVIVTSNYHTRRARFIFGRIFPANVTITIAAAPDSDFDPSNWWQTRSGLKMFLFELTGYIVARWELRNIPDAHAQVSILFFGQPVEIIFHRFSLRTRTP